MKTFPKRPRSINHPISYGPFGHYSDELQAGQFDNACGRSISWSIDPAAVGGPFLTFGLIRNWQWLLASAVIDGLRHQRQQCIGNGRTPGNRSECQLQVSGYSSIVPIPA